MAEKKSTERNPSAQLRARAEALARKNAMDVAGMEPGEVQEIIHKLRVQQIELSLRNEALHEAQRAFGKSRDRYLDLYEFAPIPYMNVNPQGKILETNLTAVGFLGRERALLLKSSFSEFLFPDAQDRWHLHLKAVFTSEDKANCELNLHTAKGENKVVRCESTFMPPHPTGGEAHCRLALFDLTERIQAEEALAELNKNLEQQVSERTAELEQSEKRYRNLVDLAPQIIYTLDPEGRFTFVNSAVANLGFTPNDLLGRNFSTLAHPEDLPRIKDHIVERRVGARATRNLKVRLLTKQGEPRAHHLSVVGYSIFTRGLWSVPDKQIHRSDKVYLGALGIAHDITEENEIKDELKESRERIKAIVDTAAEGIITIGEDGIIDTYNPAAERLFGYSAEEATGQNVKMLMPSPYREEHDQYMARYLKTGEAKVIGIGRELVGQRKDGSSFPIELSISKLHDHTQHLFTAIIRDITERKKVAEKLELEHAFNENLIRTARSIVLVLDPTGKVLLFNPYMEKLSGWSLKEARGRDWFNTFIPPPDRKAIRGLFQQALAEPRTLGNANILLTKEGKERLIEWHDAPMKDADGRLIGLLCTGQDITERRTLQREILEAASEEQRRIGQDLHDGPGQELTGLGLMADTLLQDLGDSSPRQMGIALKLSKGLKRTLRIVRKISRGLNPVEVDPEGLAFALENLAAHVSELYDIECTFKNGDKIRLDDMQVATNLYRIAQEACTNAVKHGRAKKIWIGLKDIDHKIVLSIEDDGRSFKEPLKETGLGVRIMKYRAEMIDAHLSIQPEAEKGANRLSGVVVTCELARKPGDD